MAFLRQIWGFWLIVKVLGCLAYWETDFSFLKECTQIQGLWLEGRRSDGELSVMPDMELLPNAVMVEFYGKKIR